MIPAIQELAVLYKAAADSKKSLAMSKYMKGLFVFHGIPSPKRKDIQKEWYNSINKNGNVEIRTLILELWNQNEREFHYAAIDLLIHQPKKFIQEADSELMEFLITTHSWWDSVDLIASHCVGNYCSQFPIEGAKLIKKWRKSDNMWLNRACLLHQLKYKKETDFEMLSSLIEQYQRKKEFFIQKAIGWSLREYSKTNPIAVKAFIEKVNLQGLAKREGSKYL
ncbi:MAG: DNA alkylation repair protein [Crocinitomicaceae bacterium]|nr:DNA alkylation repair protein [Crocinitomicaceae bacterium]